MDFDESFNALGARKSQYSSFYQLTLAQLMKSILEGDGINVSDDIDEIGRLFETSAIFSGRIESTLNRVKDIDDITILANEFADKATEQEFEFCISKMLRFHLACKMGESLIPGFSHSDMQRDICHHMELRRKR